MDLKLSFLHRLEETKLSAMMEILQKGIHSPQTSSAGRLFESVSSLLGLRNRNTFEGQAAIELEYLASSVKPGRGLKPYPYAIHTLDGHDHLDLKPMLRHLVEGEIHHRSKPEAAFRFHLTMAEAAVAICRRIRAESGLHTVVFSGGVFQNRLLTSLLSEMLREQGFTWYRHERIPANDGGISLGQAMIANRKVKAPTGPWFAHPYSSSNQYHGVSSY